jgi:hypothetical protein
VKIATGGKPNRLWAFVECGVSILKILTILTDLNGRMQYVPLSTADPTAEESLRLRCFATLPLFQFNDYGLVAVVVIPAADHAVDAAGTERKLVFEEDPVIA